MDMEDRKNTLEAGQGNAAQKNKAIDLAVQAIEKQFGKGSIMRLGNDQSLCAQESPAVQTA